MIPDIGAGRACHVVIAVPAETDHCIPDVQIPDGCDGRKKSFLDGRPRRSAMKLQGSSRIVRATRATDAGAFGVNGRGWRSDAGLRLGVGVGRTGGSAGLGAERAREQRGGGGEERGLSEEAAAV
jgi:hypothetical protein